MGTNTVILRDNLNRRFPHNMASTGCVHIVGGERVLAVGPFPYEPDKLHVELRVLSQLKKVTDDWKKLPDYSTVLVYTHWSPCEACARNDKNDNARIGWHVGKIFDANQTVTVRLVFRDYWTVTNAPNRHNTFRDEATAQAEYDKLCKMFWVSNQPTKKVNTGDYACTVGDRNYSWTTKQNLMIKKAT